GHAGLGAEVPDTLQLVDEPDAVLVARVVGVLERDLPGHHAAGDHRRLKARALLVGEDRQRHRMARADLVRVERADRLEPTEHAELPVVLAARRDRVHVRAHHDRRQRLAARPLAEDVAHLVHAHAQARLAHPADHEVAAALVLVGQRQPGEPAARRLADPAELLDGVRQTRAVDALGCAHGFQLYNVWLQGCEDHNPRYARLRRSSPRSSRPAPCSTSVPDSSTHARVARVSAWRTFCSTSSTVTPSALIVRTVSKIRPTSTGASPRVGSSSISIFGRAISARPIAHICCSPPASGPASWAARSWSTGTSR